MRRIVPNVGLALFGVALAALSIEVGARLIWVDPPAINAPAPPVDELPTVDSATELTTANLRAIHRGVLVETNRFGFRDREYTALPRAGVFRIVVVGDSFTMGQSVLSEQAYPNVLERLLNDGRDRPSYEVLNLGVSGQSIFDVLGRVHKLGLHLRPDLIVYGVTLNDIEGKQYVRTRTQFSFVLQQIRYNRFRRSRSRAMRLFWPRIQSLAELIHPPVSSYLFEVLHNYDPATKAWQQFLVGLKRLANIQSTKGIPVVVFQHTELFYLNAFHPFQQIYEQIEAAAEERGLRVIQSFPGFRGEAPESVTISVIDFHPNPRGHEILARQLFEGLREMGLTDDGS